MRLRWQDLNPRRSLAAALGLGLAAVTLLGAVVASTWVGEQTAGSIEHQTGTLFEQYATQVSNELDINLDAKLQWVRAAAEVYGHHPSHGEAAPAAEVAHGRRLLRQFRDGLPGLDWIGFADPQGRIRAASGAEHEGESAASRAWFENARRGPWIGGVQPDAAGARPARGGLIELAVPVLDDAGMALGVLGAELGWDWARALGTALTATLRVRETVQTLLLDARGQVLLGPQALMGRVLPTPDTSGRAAGHVVARWQDGQEYLAGWAVSDGFGAVQGLGWTVWVREPVDSALASARRQERRVFWAIVLLGLATAAAGVLLAQRLTRELARTAHSADEIRAGRRDRLEVPPGDDEAARIGRSMQALLDELRQRKAAVEYLNAELDARVAARTREVERMADENRRAAVVRERLRLARELHDTLAHSLMAVLTELRLMRRLAKADPAALHDEIVRAEAVAQEGLQEARSAILQLRRDVGDMGLGTALRALGERFHSRTGVPVVVEASAETASLADSRAETLYRIAEEALRNVERHAAAARVRLSLAERGSATGTRERVLVVEDDGLGFDAAQPPPQGHFGLRGIAEQAELLGGRLRIDSRADAGTRLEVVVPA